MACHQSGCYQWSSPHRLRAAACGAAAVGLTAKCLISVSKIYDLEPPEADQSAFFPANVREGDYHALLDQIARIDSVFLGRVPSGFHADHVPYLGLAAIVIGVFCSRRAFEGRVVDSQAEVGQLLNQGQKFGEAFDIKSIEALVPISPRDLENIQPAVGRTAKVRIGVQDFNAKIARVSPNLDERTRFAQLYLDIESVGNLYPGSFIDVTIEGPRLQNTVLLPEAAEQINESVWTVSDGKLTKKQPKFINRNVTGIVVESFSLGEGVVLGTVPGAREGMAVTTEVN